MCQLSKSILLYCQFNKIIQGPGTSFQFPALNQKHVRNVCHTIHQHLTKFYFDATKDSKETVKSVTSIYYAAMSMMMLEVLKFKNQKNLDILRTKHYFFFK